MKKIMAALIAVGLWVGLTTAAFAEFDDEDIAEMAKKLKEGKAFLKQDLYPEIGDYRQQVYINIGFASYSIDFRAQICIAIFRSGGQIVGGQIIPCKIIKKGYPKIGALITWED